MMALYLRSKDLDISWWHWKIFKVNPHQHLYLNCHRLLRKIILFKPKKNKTDCGLVFAGYSSEAAGEGDERGEEETEAAGSQLWGGVLWGSRRWGNDCLFMFLFHCACFCTNSRLNGHTTTSCWLLGFWIWICAAVLLMLHSAGDCIWPRKLFLGNASICLQLTQVGCLWNFSFLRLLHFPLLRNDRRPYSEPTRRLCPCENLQYVYLLVCLSCSAVKLPKQQDFTYTFNPSYEQQTSGTVSVVAVCITVTSSLSRCCRCMHCWSWNWIPVP